MKLRGDMASAKQIFNQDQFDQIARSFDFYIEAGLKVPLWLQKEACFLTGKTMDDLKGNGFDIEENVRNFFQDYNYELVDGVIDLNSLEMSFDDIQNAGLDQDQKHDLVLAFCNKNERAKALDHYMNQEESDSKIAELYESNATLEDLELARFYYNASIQTDEELVGEVGRGPAPEYNNNNYYKVEQQNDIPASSVHSPYATRLDVQYLGKQ